MWSDNETSEDLFGLRGLCRAFPSKKAAASRMATAVCPRPRS